MKVNPETNFIDPASGKLTWEGQNALQSITEALDLIEDPVTPGTGFGDSWSGNIAKVVDKTTTLVQETSFAGTITKTTTQSEAGTSNFVFKLDGVAFNGTANDVSTVAQSQTHSTTFTAGQKITVTASTTSLCTFAAFTIHYTRT